MSKESWLIAKQSLEGNCKETEVFIKGNTAFLSNTETLGHGCFKRKFTAKSNIKRAIWCKFDGIEECSSSCNGKEIRQKSDGTDKPEKLNGECLCLVEESSISVFTNSGHNYCCPLPFKVEKVWSMKLGLCIQRQLSSEEVANGNESGVPTIFSLKHPLDDFKPIVFQRAGSNKGMYFTDSHISIISSCKESSMILTYDQNIGGHTLWGVRKASTDDIPEPMNFDYSESNITSFYQSHHSILPLKSMLRDSLSPVSQLRHNFNHSLHAKSHLATGPMTKSPNVQHIFSPAYGSKSTYSHKSLYHEASGSSDNPIWMQRKRKLSTTTIHRGTPMSILSFAEDNYEPEPLPPDVCFEQLWTEEERSFSSPSCKESACKAFITRDITKRTFFCFLRKQAMILSMLEIASTFSDGKFKQKDYFEIPGADAGPLQDLNLMVLLEIKGDVCLYSGIHKMITLDLSSFLPLKPTPNESTPVQPLTSLNNKDEIASPIYGFKISSQLQMQSTPEVSSHKDHSFGGVRYLKDFSGSRFNVVICTNEIYQVNVPSLSNDELVKLCLEIIIKEISDPNHIVSIVRSYYCSLRNNPVDKEWIVFQNETLRLIGVPELFIEHLIKFQFFENGTSPVPPQPKKAKTAGNDDNSDASDAWELLKTKEFFHTVTNLPNHKECRCRDVQNVNSHIRLNTDAPLHPYGVKIFLSLHQLFEATKLYPQKVQTKQKLSTLLFAFASCFGLQSYMKFYKRPLQVDMFLSSAPATNDGNDENNDYIKSNIIPIIPPSIFHTLASILKKEKVIDHGFIHPELVDVIQAFSSVVNEEESMSSTERRMSQLDLHDGKHINSKSLEFPSICSGLSSEVIRKLSFGLSLPLKEMHRVTPKLLPNYLGDHQGFLKKEAVAETKAKKIDEEETDDGMDFKDKILKMRFSRDLRIKEVKALLQSSKPVPVNLIQDGTSSDHQFLKDQEAMLLIISKRTMSLPVARGMFTFGSTEPAVSEAVTIPTLNLSGEAALTNKVISISSQVELPPDFKSWPLFHNGVAAGLKISKPKSKVDSTWIVYNRLKCDELTEEHCGFLMALGLTGHLSVLTDFQVVDYLYQVQEFSLIALLLGMSAAFKGSGNVNIMKLLSIHIEPLLPPTTLDLTIPKSSQVAAILGTGLLFHSTCDRHLCNVFLEEIEKPQCGDAEATACCESYALSLGFAIGLILLGQGDNLSAFQDMNIEQTLYRYIHGGRAGYKSNPHDLPKSSSYVNQEEKLLNTNLTSPSGIVALGLIYIRTNNRSIASWLKAPHSLALFENIQPDHLLLMTTAYGLIMFDETVPTKEWIDHLLPKILHNEDSITSSNIPDEDRTTLMQCRCAIITGACLAIGLKFAGSHNRQAFDLLLSYIQKFKLYGSGIKLTLLGNHAANMSTNSLLISASLVMAGSGNLDLLRIARQFHKKCTPAMTYGCHMASHMAIGFLFLGAGRQILKTDNLSIALLLCSIYPKFPSTSGDNRYHLQAWRHLYVLACEERMVEPCDSQTGEICYVPIEVHFKETSSYDSSKVTMFAPCFVPELHLITKINVIGPRYFQQSIDIADQTKSHDDLLNQLNCLMVDKKMGSLPYAEDPKGYKHLMAQTFPGQTNKVEVIKSFSNNPYVLAFTDLFCQDIDQDSVKSPSSNQSSDFFAKVLLECLTYEKEEALSYYIDIEQTVKDVENGIINLDKIWQIKFILLYYEHAFSRYKNAQQSFLDIIYVNQVSMRLKMALRRSSGPTENQPHSQLQHIAIEASKILNL